MYDILLSRLNPDKERDMAGTQRKTKQKQAIYDALAALDHPTATQVYERVQ